MSEQPQTRLQLLDQLVEITHKLRDHESDFENSLETKPVYEEHEALLLNTFQMANDGIIVFREGLIILANPRFCEIVGAPLQELVGTTGYQYIPPDLIWVDVLDQEGNVVFWNSAAEEISGYTKKRRKNDPYPRRNS